MNSHEEQKGMFGAMKQKECHIDCLILLESLKEVIKTVSNISSCKN